MRIAVLGTGHVGLATAATLANMGHDVAGADVDLEKVTALQRGQVPFFEPGLQELVEVEMSAGRLAFSARGSDVIPGREVVFLCVGTPPDAEGYANLVSVEQSATEIARWATGPVVVAEKSTVPAGTAARLRAILARNRPDVRFEVVSNPEFLREGQAIRDLLEPDRILIGASTPSAFETMRRVYEPLTGSGCRLIETDIRTAELAKHSCNAFLALKISYANALARLCEAAGADVTSVAEVMGSDPRIGPDFLNAGLGYGGYCFPKDVAAMERLSEQLGYRFPLLGEIARINQEALEAVVRKIREALWNVEGKTILQLGLAFKPGTDDVRFSPALALARRLLEMGARVIAYDPQASAPAKAELPELEIGSDPYGSTVGADALVIATEWDEFRALDLGRLRDAMAHPVIVDGRNVLDPDAVREAGFSYYSVGRPSFTDVGAA